MTTNHWLALFIAANVLDAALTMYALKLGASELNPLIRLLMKVLPPWAALLSIKAAFVLIVAASLDVVADSLPWLTAVFAGVCIWNAVQILRLRKTTPG